MNKGRRVVISAAERISRLPPYLFAEIDRQKSAARRRGMDLIDFGIGDPDLPTPSFIVDAAREAVADPACHRYPAGAGSRSFQDAAAAWWPRSSGSAPTATSPWRP